VKPSAAGSPALKTFYCSVQFHLFCTIQRNTTIVIHTYSSNRNTISITDSLSKLLSFSLTIETSVYKVKMKVSTCKVVDIIMWIEYVGRMRIMWIE